MKTIKKTTDFWLIEAKFEKNNLLFQLLKSNDNKYRIVMRREQVHKLCANFRIEKSMKLSPKPNLPNVLTFMCQVAIFNFFLYKNVL